MRFNLSDIIIFEFGFLKCQIENNLLDSKDNMLWETILCLKKCSNDNEDTIIKDSCEDSFEKNIDSLNEQEKKYL